MKIGILTYHKSINYGSVLQAWALQNILKSMGHDAEIIDYEPEHYRIHYGSWLPWTNAKNVCKNLLRLPIIKYKNQQINRFAEFREKKLKTSIEKYNAKSDPKELESAYDCIICGSDQIWNVHALDCDDFYFLPNVRMKKIAYAISVNNTDYSESRCDSEMRRWIIDFDFISCREESGAMKIKRFINGEKEVFTVLDPTLLHDMVDYDSIVSPRLIDNDYIFMYKVWPGNDSFKTAVSLGKRLHMPVYTLFMSKDVRSLIKIEKHGIKVITNNTKPEDYLSLIRYAAYVLTDSFHGTAFSVIFERPFFCIREKMDDGREKDERIVSLLNLLGEENRYVCLDEIDSFDINKRPDYSRITLKRKAQAQIDTFRLKNAII